MGLEFIATMTGLIALILVCGCAAWMFEQVEQWLVANQISRGVLGIFIACAFACAALIITFSYMGAV